MNQQTAHSPGPSEESEDRRSDREPPVRALKLELNAAQLDALITLEKFGWYLEFIRHNPPHAPVGILCDPDKHKYALLTEKGELIESPAFESFRN